MSSFYTVQPGDTFETIARREYGVADYAELIAKGNPGAFEPLTAGVELYVPPSPIANDDATPTAAASSPDEVAVLLNGARFRFWDSMRLTRSMTSVDTFLIGGPFEPSDAAHREAFRPFTFKDIDVSIGGAPRFKGTALAPNPVTNPTSKTVSLNGYSRCGVLNDCTAPVSAYPLEFNEQTLKQIADTLLQPFGIKAVFEGDPGAPFERVALQTSAKIAGFLGRLASQVNLVMSSDESGNLLFRNPEAATVPGANLREGSSPLISIKPTFNPQQYYSHVSGISPTIIGIPGEPFTAKNELYRGPLRPFVFSASDTEVTPQIATQAKLGRMFGGSASYVAEVTTWRDSKGNLWEPNTLINVEAPGAMIYKPYNFLLKSVTYVKNTVSKTATLELVLPGSYSGKTPEGLPWDE